MRDFEKLGLFYLGRHDAEPFLYEARDLTTHAVIVGMTGSGKTGLGIALIEEAAIDGVPTIAIDPKGDLGNLLLTFPSLSAEEFSGWVEEEGSADEVATRWREGLAAWGQDAARVKRFRDAVALAIYTPGSSAGIPLSILRSLSVPDAAVIADAEALRERISGTVSGLLALLGIEGDPLRSREHILLAKIVEAAWKGGKAVDLPALIRDIQKPPFAQVGIVDVESFFPGKERAELAMTLNNLLASPGFEAWLTGEPLDVQRLLWTASGKPRVSILSIAHLPDPERMFFVTLLLNEVVAWMRAQSGTGSLRAMLYMDEVFGYFPPSANPPAKQPMLTLLKQARAFGLGCVLSTQNPVDLDYKGLANAGTWFLGRLQTERDKLRVIEGLEGASAAAGKAFDRPRLDATLAGLKKREFLVNNVHEDAPILMETRHTLSYLRGPLTRKQIQALTDAPRPAAAPAVAPDLSGVGARPVLPLGVREAFLRSKEAGRAGERLVYRPALLGTAKLHFVDAKARVDAWRDVALLLPMDDGEAAWDDAEDLAGDADAESAPDPSGVFDALPAAASEPKSFAAWSRRLADTLYRTRTLDLPRAPSLQLVAAPGESEGDFRIRVQQAARERRDRAVDELRAKYASRIATVRDRETRAGERVERERSQATQQTMQTAISFGATLLGAILGRKTLSTGTVGRATTAARGVGRTLKERQDIEGAEQGVEAIRKKRETLEAELDAAVQELSESIGPAQVVVESTSIKPRKSDVTVDGVALAWVPWWVGEGGSARPAR